ncbi:MAG: hypothetical protein WA208_02305, partial [Thermoanaerobaculia bacterium]
SWRARFPRTRVPPVLAWAMTLAFVTLCWVPFRAVSFGATSDMWIALAGLGEGRDVWWPALLPLGLAIVILGHVAGVAMMKHAGAFAAIDGEVMHDAISGRFLVFRARTVAGAFAVAAAVMAIYFFGAVETSPFIYFQF